MNSGLKKYNKHSTERLTEIFVRNTNFDVLFMGSSRTHSGINPKIIDSLCHVNSYNAGIDGSNLLELKMTFDAYLQNHPDPKLLVLTIDLSSFTLNKKFFNYTQYFPFISNKIIDSTLCNNGHNTLPIKIFPFLTFIDYDDYIKGIAIKGITGIGGTEIPAGDFEYKGYLSNTEQYISANHVVESISAVEISDSAIDYLNKIVKACKEKKIKLIFTYAPEYNYELQKHISNADIIFTLITKIANDNNIEYFRDDGLDICKNPKLFTNPGHLNRNGSDQYSTILANKITNSL